MYISASLFLSMAKSPLHFSLVQYDIHWEQPARNLLKLEQMFDDNGLENCDILFLPEMFTTGFTMNAQAMAEDMSGNTLSWLQDQCREYRTDMVGSLIVKEDDKYFNRLIWMGRDGLKATYDKHHLFTMAGEDKAFHPGSATTTVNVKGWNFRPFICYDLRFPVWNRISNEIDVLVFIANWPERRVYHWKQLLIARAIENQAYVIGLNRVGWDGEQHYYSGASAVIDAMGKPQLSLGSSEGIQNGTLDGVSHEITRRDLPFLNDADSFTVNV